MPRRVSLPGAAELFRTTQEPNQSRTDHDPAGRQMPDQQLADPGPRHPDHAGTGEATNPPGRETSVVGGNLHGCDNACTVATPDPEKPGRHDADPEADEAGFSGPASDPGASGLTATDPGGEATGSAAPSSEASDPPGHRDQPRRRSGGSGRVKHEEKITVYVSSDELLGLEHARLSLRAEHGMAVDRGRIVREALALVLNDLSEYGTDSQLVHRLSRP